MQWFEDSKHHEPLVIISHFFAYKDTVLCFSKKIEEIGKMTAMTQEEIVSSTKTVIQGLEALKSEHNQVIMALCGAKYKTHLIDSHNVNVLSP